MIGEPLGILATGMTGEGGTFEITGIETTSTLGIMIVATDCDGEDATMYPSATGVSADSYSGLADGGVANSNAYQLMLPKMATPPHSPSKAD
jgi:hypothetical protein